MTERIKSLEFLSKEFLIKNYSLYFLTLFLLSTSFATIAKTANTSDPIKNSILSFENEAYLLLFNKKSERISYDIACPIVLFIEPLAAICLDSTINSLQLNVAIQGSDGSGFGVWSGTGIVDPINGIFDPSDSLAIIGDNIITYTFIENGCIITENTTITLHPLPDASFSIDSPICSNDYSNIISVSTTGGNYEWDFYGGVVNSGNNEGPYEVSWPSEGSYAISLKVTDQNGCTSSGSQTIEVEKPLGAPIIDCISTTTEIVFNWGDVSGALSHEVELIDGQAGIEGPNIYSVSNLIPGGDSVTIQVSAVGPLPCGNSTTLKTCYTIDCPSLTINLLPVPDICLYPDVTNIELMANIENYDAPGIWSGNGIIDSTLGIFDPNHQSVNNGSNIILVTFTDEGCENKDSVNINVFEIPTADAGGTDEINCADSEISLSGNATGSNLAFNWSGPGILSGFNSLFPLVSHPGTYYLNVTDTLSTCSISDSVIVTIDSNVPLADAGSDKEITCDSSSVTLQGNGTVGQNFQFIWHGPGINGGNLYAQNPVVSIPGYYVLEVL